MSDLIGKIIDGGEGANRLLGRGDAANLDFAAAANGSIRRVERIELDPGESNRLAVDPDAIRRVVGNDANLVVRGDSDDDIQIGLGWQTQAPKEIDDLFHQLFHDEQLSLAVATDTPFRNVLEPADVNADGEVTAVDALLIISALRRARSAEVQLDENRLVNGETLQFEDVSGDGRITVLDALQVINAIARSRAMAASPEFLPTRQDDSDDDETPAGASPPPTQPLLF